jgi:hypothetical protein
VAEEKEVEKTKIARKKHHTWRGLKEIHFR